MRRRCGVMWRAECGEGVVYCGESLNTWIKNDIIMRCWIDNVLLDESGVNLRSLLVGLIGSAGLSGRADSGWIVPYLGVRSSKHSFQAKVKASKFDIWSQNSNEFLHVNLIYHVCIWSMGPHICPILMKHQISAGSSSTFAWHQDMSLDSTIWCFGP